MRAVIHRLSLLASFSIACAATGPAFANRGFFADVTGGTLGIGPELGFRLNKHLAVRANATFLGVNHGYDSDDINYRGHIGLKSGGAMADLYPFGGGFRLSAGFRINGNHANVNATPTGPIQIGGTVYNAPSGSFVHGSADAKNFAPALTLGYIRNYRSGFVIGLEAGALFQGSIRINSFTTNIPGVSTASLEAERLSVQHDVNKYKVYPIGQLILGWRF